MGTANATSAFPPATFGGNITGTTSPVKIYPSTDSTTAVQILKADGTTAIMTFDTTNRNVGIGTGVPSATNRLDVADTTLAGSGSLAGSVLNLAQTWNTTGTPTAIKLNVTNTASNAASLLMDLQVGGASVFSLKPSGVLSIASNISCGGVSLGGSGIISGAGTLSAPVILASQTSTATSGALVAVKISPTYNQASGTAANTDLLINRTETAVGSGAQLLIDAQVGGVSRASVKNTGVINQRVFTVATLPTGAAGDRSFVSDALAPTFGATVVGGGAVTVPTYYDGTSWKAG